MSQNPLRPWQLLVGIVALTALGAPAHATTQETGRRAQPNVRYVRIELPGKNRILSLAEVQVMRGDRNIATGGVASQSATEGGAMAGRAIDGNTSGDFAQGSGTHTPASEAPWWELDLGKSQSVEQVTVWNRTDCCGDRLNNFTLQLLDRRREVLFERKNLRAPQPRTDYLMTGETVIAGAPIEQIEVSVERRQVLQPAINTAIDRGVQHLKDCQLRDGSWGAHTPAYRAGQTALSLYTLVKCGVPRTDPAVQMGLRYLERYPPVKTYSIGIAMMLYETLADEAMLNELQGLLDRLVETQIGGEGGNAGLWGYPHGCDLSNTQYAALGLMAAHRAGLKVPPEVFRSLLAGTLRNQEIPVIVEVERKEGETSTGEIRMAGFSYRNSNPPGRATHTMTTAGISIIAICERGLEGKRGGKELLEAATARRMGMEWLDRNFSVNASGKWNLYYLYGLERVGALLGIDYVGGKHWYWEGADPIVRKQKEHGGWNDQPDTCFALLFLSKATAGGAATGPTRMAREDVRSSDGPNVDIRWMATGTNPVTMWISGFHEALIDDYSEEGGLVEGLRITRVDYLCDGEVVATIPGDPSKGWNGERYPTQYEYSGPGTYRMEVAVRFVDPLAQAGESGETEMVSMPLDVLVRDQFRPEAIEAGFRRDSPNLLREPGVTSSVSSHLGKGNELDKVLDGSQGTNWLCAQGDEVPTLTFQFEEPVRANTLVLSDANSSILNMNTYDRPTRIEVNINKQRKPKPVDVSGGVLSNWSLEFKTTRVRSITIRILERESGKAKPGIAGFSEVELRFDR